MTTTAYVLRTCNPDGTSSHGFRWPLTPGAEVTCPDWNPEPHCGNGLHGFLNGEGDGELANWSPDAVWMVLSVPVDTIVDLDGKVKFPAAVVRYAGTRLEATALINELAPGHAVIGGTATAGDRGTATAGYRGTATAGYEGTLVIKHWGGGRYRLAVGYVGENGIKADVPYRLDDAGQFVEVSK